MTNSKSIVSLMLVLVAFTATVTSQTVLDLSPNFSNYVVASEGGAVQPYIENEAWVLPYPGSVTSGWFAYSALTSQQEFSCSSVTFEALSNKTGVTFVNDTLPDQGGNIIPGLQNDMVLFIGDHTAEEQWTGGHEYGFVLLMNGTTQAYLQHGLIYANYTNVAVNDNEFHNYTITVTKIGATTHFTYYIDTSEVLEISYNCGEYNYLQEDNFHAVLCVHRYGVQTWDSLQSYMQVNRIVVTEVN